MKLITCKGCGTQVSKQAVQCHNCSYTLRKPKRGVFGTIIKWSFIGFNLLMLYWLIAGTSSAAETIATSEDEWEAAGATIGTGLGAMFILFIWIVGAFILGLLTYFTKAKPLMIQPQQRVVNNYMVHQPAPQPTPQPQPVYYTAPNPKPVQLKAIPQQVSQRHQALLDDLFG